MKTKTFEGSTREDAENNKARWLAANRGVVVRNTRAIPLATARRQVTN